MASEYASALGPMLDKPTRSIGNIAIRTRKKIVKATGTMHHRIRHRSIFPFLELPPEIRTTIYEYCFVIDEPPLRAPTTRTTSFFPGHSFTENGRPESAVPHAKAWTHGRNDYRRIVGTLSMIERFVDRTDLCFLGRLRGISILLSCKQIYDEARGILLRPPGFDYVRIEMAKSPPKFSVEPRVLQCSGWVLWWPKSETEYQRRLRRMRPQDLRMAHHMPVAYFRSFLAISGWQRASWDLQSYHVLPSRSDEDVGLDVAARFSAFSCMIGSRPVSRVCPTDGSAVSQRLFVGVHLYQNRPHALDLKSWIKCVDIGRGETWYRNPRTREIVPYREHPEWIANYPESETDRWLRKYATFRLAAILVLAITAITDPLLSLWIISPKYLVDTDRARVLLHLQAWCENCRP
ncbi:hypothetical protein LTR50_003509 [Elasticomyces elasticus]|nr:hypothetical protein LTR50_003509 [Elasticomyces elasticus]